MRISADWVRRRRGMRPDGVARGLTPRAGRVPAWPSPPSENRRLRVAATLADVCAPRARLATAMIDSPLGELVRGRVRESGVTPFYKNFKSDGVRGPTIATVYSDRGSGVRAPVVFYNRANEAGAL